MSRQFEMDPILAEFGIDTSQILEKGEVVLGPNVFSPSLARRFWEDGCMRFRMPHHKFILPRMDTDSMDFRGVRAALNATDTLPREYDENGNTLAGDPEAYRKHFDLGLDEIIAAGQGMPVLEPKFVAGYTRWASAIVREAEQLNPQQ